MISHIHINEIRKSADELRTKYGGEIPVDIELIAENEGLIIIPVADLKRSTGVAACVSPKLDEIYVDLETYRDPKQVFYLRFTFAHEMGHVRLHQEFFRDYQAANVKNVIEWADLVQRLTTQQFTRLEFTANEFAGRLLVPPHALQAAVNEVKLPDMGETDLPTDYLIAGLARMVHRQFEVSPRVIELRIQRENISLPGR